MAAVQLLLELGLLLRLPVRLLPVRQLVPLEPLLVPQPLEQLHLEWELLRQVLPE